MKLINKCGHEVLRKLLENGIGVHHAGITRPDRKLVEKLFADGCCRLLVTTATLAWGVNLPARMVVIKGTNVFDSSSGGFIDLNILDVLQIFGRAGRPDFDQEGEAILLTAFDKVDQYARKLTHQLPLESKFLEMIADHLNAEIAIGNVVDAESGAAWLRHTFAFVRMRRYARDAHTPTHIDGVYTHRVFRIYVRDAA